MAAKRQHGAGAADQARCAGELDWIVMKALEKDRTRRYETANGLARDVERYLHTSRSRPARPAPATGCGSSCAGTGWAPLDGGGRSGSAGGGGGGQHLAGGPGDAGPRGTPRRSASSCRTTCWGRRTWRTSPARARAAIRM